MSWPQSSRTLWLWKSRSQEPKLAWAYLYFFLTVVYCQLLHLTLDPHHYKMTLRIHNKAWQTQASSNPIVKDTVKMTQESCRLDCSAILGLNCWSHQCNWDMCWFIYFILFFFGSVATQLHVTWNKSFQGNLNACPWAVVIHIWLWINHFLLKLSSYFMSECVCLSLSGNFLRKSACFPACSM